MARCNTSSRDDVVRTISALLVSEKPSYNIPVAKLDTNYRQEEGERIPYKELGFPTLIDFLRTIPSIQLHTRDGMTVINFLGTEKTRHVSELVAKQKTSAKPQRHRSMSRYNKSVPSNYYSRVTRHATSLTRAKDPSMTSLVLDMVQNETRGLTKNVIIYRMRDKKPSIYFDFRELNEILESLGNKVQIRGDVVYAANVNGARSNDVPWVTSKEFNEESRRIQKPLVNFALDKDEIDDLGEDLGDFDYVGAAEKGGNEGKMANGGDANEENGVGMIINDRMKFRLEKLIQNRPKGIFCADLPKIFMEEYKIPLEWEELGFNSLSDLVLQLPDVFRCIQPNPAGDFQLFHAKSAGNLNLAKPTMASVYKVYKDPEDDVPAVPATIPSHMINNLIPDDVVPMGESIGQIPMTCFDPDQKGYEEVVVCDAFSPSFFWIQLRRKQLKLGDMMNSLENFYCKYESKYTVPLIILERGLNVVCRFYGKWHRGIVKAVEPDQDSTTSILYYDYGTLHKHPASELRFLHRQFSQLPAQAIPCALYNIKPPDGNEIRTPEGKVKLVWPIQTSRTFVQRVHDKPLVAMCGKMYLENNSLLISLTDTSSEEDLNIGDWLVDNGLAIHGTMDLIVDPSDLSLYAECHEWDDNSEVEPIIQNPPPGFSSHSDDNVQLIQNLLNQLKESKAYEARFFYRNIQFTSLLNAVDDLINGIIDLKMLDVDVLKTMRRDVEEDKKTIRSNYSAIDDCYCRVIRVNENGGENSQNSIEIKVNENENEKAISSESSDDLTFLLTSSNIREQKNAEICNDETESYHSHSPPPQLDETESIWSVGHLSDTNPFKYDVYVSPEVIRIPPPIPPRTRGNPVKIFPEVNNNETNNNEHKPRILPFSEFKPALPPRNVQNVQTMQEMEKSGGVKEQVRPDCLQVELSKCTMFIFFIDNQGWITIDQFRVGLTNFSDPQVIKKVLHEQKYQEWVKVVGKRENPKLFNLIDVKTRECSISKSEKFYLIPVNRILLKMQKALKIVSREDIKHLMGNQGATNNPLLRDCSTLLITYFNWQEIN